jgi:hypothetical protein
VDEAQVKLSTGLDTQVNLLRLILDVKRFKGLNQRKKKINILFIDFKSAFDMVNWKILL